MQRHAAAHHRAHVRRAHLAHNFALAGRERLLVRVDHGRVRPARADVADALGVGRQLDRPLRRDGVAWVEDGGAGH